MQMVAVGVTVTFVCQRYREREVLLATVFKNLYLLKTKVGLASFYLGTHLFQ